MLHGLQENIIVPFQLMWNKDMKSKFIADIHSLRVAHIKPDIITRILIRVLPLLEAELCEGAIVSIDEKEYRIKKLPV